jgi:hypothetical protein
MTDADRDILAGRIQFYFCGAIAAYAPGVPDQIPNAALPPANRWL